MARANRSQRGEWGLLGLLMLGLLFSALPVEFFTDRMDQVGVDAVGVGVVAASFAISTVALCYSVAWY